MTAFLKALDGSGGRNTTPDELDVLAKHAANLFHSGKFSNMTDAVTNVVKTAALSVQQVRRVVEIANTTAAVQDFKKEGRDHRYIEIKGGPADPEVVLSRCNTVEVKQASQTNDYAFSPTRDLQVVSGPDRELKLYERPQEVVRQLNKEAAERDSAGPAYVRLQHEHTNLQAETRMVESQMRRALDELYEHTKEAMQNGTPLGGIASAWSRVAPLEHLKVAFSFLGERMVGDGLTTYGNFKQDLQKVAHGVLNVEHPVVKTYLSFCAALSKVAQHTQTLEKQASALDRLRELIILEEKVAASADVGQALGKGLRAAGKATGRVLGESGAVLRDGTQGLLEGLGVGGEIAGLGGAAAGVLPYAGAGYLGLRAVDAVGQRLAESPLVPVLVPQGSDPAYGGY